MEPQRASYAAVPDLILASSSPYRRGLLARLQLPFKTVSPNVDETPEHDESFEQCAMRLSRLKAHAPSKDNPHALIIGSDQVAECDGLRLDKAGNLSRAIQQLTWTSGKQANFYTALTLLNTSTGNEQTRVISTRVRYRTLTVPEIERYLDKEMAFDCAGSAKAESLGISLLTAIEGSDPTALIGLPLIALCEMLRNENVDIP